MATRPAAGAGEGLARALGLHRQGRLDEAAAIYHDVLRQEPRNHDALTFLGTVYLQRGNFAESARLIAASLAINPAQPNACNNLANALKGLNRLDEALVSYGRAIALQPDNVDVLNDRGNLLRELGRPDEALASYERAIALRPDYARVFNNRGNALLDLKRPDEALVSFEKAIALQPDYANAFSGHGNVLRELGRPEEALASYERAIMLNPGFADVFNNQGLTLVALKRLDEALVSYDRALALNPGNAVVFNNRGIVLRDMKRLDEALASYERAIALNSRLAEVFNNYGIALWELKRTNEALASYERAIALRPNYAEAFNSRGIALGELNRPDEALASYDRALALNPCNAEAFSNRGNILQILGRPDEALASCDRAIALKPDYADGYWNKSLIRLLTGDFAEGWRLYEWRWQGVQKEFARNFAQPLWLGEQPIAGKTVLLHAEQGLGDTLQFCRYAPLVAALGARVVIEVQAPLLPLLSSLAGNFTMVVKGEPLPAFDLHCPLMSLPLAFKTTLATIPAKVPYLVADPGKVGEWRQRLGAKTRPRIGLAWSGSAQHRNDRNRSLPLERLAALLALPFEFHSLQKEIAPNDAAGLPAFPQLILHQDELRDFADTAALVQAMDLVLSVDTSIAHLAGALGKPLWLLLPFAPDFRWLLDRDDSPWYPTARLFRQSTIGDWESVLGRIVGELEATRLG